MGNSNIYKLSYSFKIWLLFYISSATAYRLIKTFYFPNVPIVSDQVIIATVLISLVHIWGKEIQDRRDLQEINILLTQANKKLKHTNINTITSLIRSVEAKDPYTSGHSERVTRYTLAIAKKMSLPESETQILRNACLLHDIGKISMPDSILHKNTPLTIEDWNIIKRHPQAGIDILDPLDFLEQEKIIILHHHERYDGTGYPGGLKAEAIPQGARIIALADAYDAMKSKRPYRDSLQASSIEQEITKNSGIQFDPKIVHIFQNLIKEGFLK